MLFVDFNSRYVYRHFFYFRTIFINAILFYLNLVAVRKKIHDFRVICKLNESRVFF